MRSLREQGLGIVFVTHFLDQVYEVTDRITVLRNGKLVGSYDTATFPRLDLVSAMIGRDARELDSEHVVRATTTEPPMVSTDKLGRKKSVQGLMVSVAPGEVLGIAGLLGSGRTEAIRLLFGIDGATEGTISIDGHTVRRHSTARAIKLGFGLCAEDRKTEGLAQSRSIADNATLSHLRPYRRFGWLNLSQRSRAVSDWMRKLNVKAASQEQAVQELSGGNQQKVALARVLHQEADEIGRAHV